MIYHRLPRRVTVLLLLAALIMTAASSAAGLLLPPPEAMSSITARDLKTHLSFLASDELGGRYTLSPSIRIAARYLASQLESYGYRGAARDGSFFQKVPISTRAVDLASSRVVLDAGTSRQEFKYADDFAALTPFDMDVRGEMVFVGYGISSPAHKHDDYAGLDVKGKIVVIAGGAPETLIGVRLSDEESGYRLASARGAAGVILMPPSQLLLAWPQARTYMTREQISLPPRANQSNQSNKVTPVISAGPELIKAIAKAMGKESSYLVSPGGKPLQSARISATAEVKMQVSVKETAPAHNVVGVLEGADPRLKDEYIVFSAHYDHEPTNSRGEVYNGADDDGSGTVAILEIAQAFSTGPRPPRSILIVFHTAEELGLLGSEFNTDYEPVVPLNKLVANFNIDMIGRSRAEDNTDARDRELTDKDSVYVIGADKLSSELHRISEQSNAETSRLKFDYTYNDENHPQRFYYRSDHYNYAKHGIPVIFYFTGVHRDYHRPTDDIEKIDFVKMERITRMIFATGWNVATLDHRLVADKKAASSSAK